jgi:hypothetical protein
MLRPHRSEKVTAEHGTGAQTPRGAVPSSRLGRTFNPGREPARTGRGSSPAPCVRWNSGQLPVPPLVCGERPCPAAPAVPPIDYVRGERLGFLSASCRPGKQKSPATSRVPSSRSRGANRNPRRQTHKSQDRVSGLRSRERELSEGQSWSLLSYSSGHVDLDALPVGAGARSIRASAGPNPARSYSGMDLSVGLSTTRTKSFSSA